MFPKQCCFFCCYISVGFAKLSLWLFCLLRHEKAKKSQLSGEEFTWPMLPSANCTATCWHKSLTKIYALLHLFSLKYFKCKPGLLVPKWTFNSSNFTLYVKSLLILWRKFDWFQYFGLNSFSVKKNASNLDLKTACWGCLQLELLHGSYHSSCIRYEQSSWVWMQNIATLKSH